MYVLGVYHSLYDVILAVSACLLSIYIFYLLIRSDIEFNRTFIQDRKHTEEIHTTPSEHKKSSTKTKVVNKKITKKEE